MQNSYTGMLWEVKNELCDREAPLYFVSKEEAEMYLTIYNTERSNYVISGVRHVEDLDKYIKILLHVEG